MIEVCYVTANIPVCSFPDRLSCLFRDSLILHLLLFLWKQQVKFISVAASFNHRLSWPSIMSDWPQTIISVLFISNHECTSWRQFSKGCTALCLINLQVLSKTVKSYMMLLKNRAKEASRTVPRMEPCGTPQLLGDAAGKNWPTKAGKRLSARFDQSWSWTEMSGWVCCVKSSSKNQNQNQNQNTISE